MQANLAPTSSPFLQKFSGKQQKVNRDGLLHLLNGNKPQSKQKNDTPVKIKVKTPSIKDVIQLNKYSSNILEADSSPNLPLKPQQNIFSSQQLKVSKSQRALDGMAFHLSKRNSSKAFESNMFKLPPISRSNSQNNNILSKNAFIPNAEMIESDRSHRKKSSSGSFYSKNSDRATRQMQLDEFVLRHMEFLHKFEKQLISNRLSQGSKSLKQ